MESSCPSGRSDSHIRRTNLKGSGHTIKSKLKAIYRKLGVSSRTQAVTRARELGLLEG
jgi:ATP/maltotriose-dependent transcriptional regulator MalT